MKYRLIGTPGFPVKHVSELKEGDGVVVYLHRNGEVYVALEKAGSWWPADDPGHNPTGLVARAFEVAQGEWTWKCHGPNCYTVRHCGQSHGVLDTEQAAREYCEWKNGGGV